MVLRAVKNIVAGTICLVALLSCTKHRDGLSADFSAPISEAPPYSINGETVWPNKGSSVSLLANIRGDLNADGYEDLAAIIVHNSDGSGVFFYLNVFVGDGDGGWRFIGEEFLGDRLRFDMLDIYSGESVSSVPIHPDDDGMLVVGYFVHADAQSFADEPAFYITKHWRVLDEMLVQVVH